jgi:hypothetical protein
MNSTENSYQNEKKDIDGLRSDFDYILKQIQELQIKIRERKGNMAVPVQETTPVEAIDNNLLYDQIKDNDMNSTSNNKSESDSQDNSISGFTTNLKINSTILPPLKTPDYKIKYTDDKIQKYHDVASNETWTRNMDNEEKYNIIINAEKRLKYLNYKKETNTDEYRRLNDIYNRCINSDDKHCEKIKTEWENRNLRPNTSRPNTSRPNTPRENPNEKLTPRQGSRQIRKGGKKTRKTSHRKTKRRRINKKSHSHKKRH